MKLLNFSFAGGSKYSYQNFFSNKSEAIIMEYPGRGMRINEKFITEIDTLIEDLLPKVMEEINSCEEYIIYGHSMGALVGYLLCQKIEEMGFKKPQKLVVSGKKAPSIERKLKIAHLPDEEFWQEVIKLGGIPDELQNQTELIDFYIPILKADFTAVENYKYVKNKKLTIPIDVYYGSEEATEEDMIGWREETTEKVTITQMKGNHFFIFDHVEYFQSYFNNLNSVNV